jgi:ATP-binding cassette subfamily C (CFTR/MRP) protein 1
MNFIMSRQAMWLEAIEKRISATSAMLASMKGVKMSGLGDTLLASLQKLRVEEMRISKRFRKLLIWNMVFGKCKLSISLRVIE